MRLIGLLNWYDESPERLVECLMGLKRAGVSTVVAVDGAYKLFPGGKPSSPPQQRHIIDLTCREYGMGSLVYVPKYTWAGNEVEKRTFMHALALSVSQRGTDWHMVMDADQVIRTVPPDLHSRLTSCHQDAAEVTFHENGKYLSAPRILFRAIPLVLARNHYTYMAGKRVLWSAGDIPQEGALDMRDLVVDHHPTKRSTTRLENRSGYYQSRDEKQTELVACAVCYKRAVRKMPRGWHMTDNGYAAEWIEVCNQCYPGVDATNQGKLAAMGIDPHTITVVTHDGLAYAVAEHTRGLPDKFNEWLKGQK